MFPYGVFVVTAIDPATLQVAAATIHWVTQTAFEPLLLIAAIKADHPVLPIIRATHRFALNILGKDDVGEAFTFYRPASLAGSLDAGGATLGGYGVMWGRHGTVLLLNAVSVLECGMRAVLEAGDHFPVVAEVIAIHNRLPPQGRPDSMILRLEELGETRFYGG